MVLAIIIHYTWYVECISLNKLGKKLSPLFFKYLPFKCLLRIRIKIKNILIIIKIIIGIFLKYCTCTYGKMHLISYVKKNPYSCMLLGNNVFYILYNLHVYKYLCRCKEVQRKKASNIGDCVKIFRRLWFIILIKHTTHCGKNISICYINLFINFFLDISLVLSILK